MGLPHLVPGEVLNLQNVEGELPRNSTFALVKASDFEVIRMVIPAGKQISEHSVPGKITVQCIKGHTRFLIGSEVRELKMGDWLYLEGNQPHALEGIDDSVLLVTILLT
jgi:quercetin dioxygenase-like cupin family protein